MFKELNMMIKKNEKCVENYASTELDLKLLF